MFLAIKMEIFFYWTGEYVIKIQDATTPPFMDMHIEPVFILLKVAAPKKPPKAKKIKDKGPK